MTKEEFESVAVESPVLEKCLALADKITSLYIEIDRLNDELDKKQREIDELKLKLYRQ